MFICVIINQFCCTYHDPCARSCYTSPGLRLFVNSYRGLLYKINMAECRERTRGFYLLWILTSYVASAYAFNVWFFINQNINLACFYKFCYKISDSCYFAKNAIKWNGASGRRRWEMAKCGLGEEKRHFLHDLPKLILYLCLECDAGGSRNFEE